MAITVNTAGGAVSTTGDVTPDPTTTTTNDDLYIGQSADGTMLIDGGSEVDSEASFVGYNAGVLGTASITGAGSVWNAESVGIGQSGDGEVVVADGAKLAVPDIDCCGWRSRAI